MGSSQLDGSFIKIRIAKCSDSEENLITGNPYSETGHLALPASRRGNNSSEDSLYCECESGSKELVGK